MQAPQWRVIKYSICSLLVLVYSWKIKWFSQTLILMFLLEKNTQTCSMDPTSNFLGMMLIGFSVPWQSCTPSCWGNRQFFQSVRGTYPSVKLNRWGSSGCKPQTSSLGTEVKEAAIQCLIQTSGLLSSLHPIPALKRWLAGDTLILQLHQGQ